LVVVRREYNAVQYEEAESRRMGQRHTLWSDIRHTKHKERKRICCGGVREREGTE
jgi:hypothetical protein